MPMAGRGGTASGVPLLPTMKRARFGPAYDLSGRATRGGGPAWSDIAYLGRGGAFGLPDPACLSIPRSDNGQSLEATLKQRGFDPQPIRARRRLLDPSGIRAYLELHIEQGPTLVARGLPAAVVSGIRGCN